MEWNDLQDARLAVITDLASKAPGGHVGRTALMKFCYLLQVVKGVPLGYRFTLYSYGPFDSAVLSDLGTAEGLRAVTSTTRYYSGGYGYEIRAGGNAEYALGAGAQFLEEHRASIDWVLGEFGAHGSADLELESTVIFVLRDARRKGETISRGQLAQRVHEVKPHFTEDYIRAKIADLAQLGLLEGVVAQRHSGG